MTAGRSEAPWGRSLVDEILESIPDPVIGCMPDGTVVYWSRAARELYGYSAAQALGQPVLRLLRTRFPAPLVEVMAEVTEMGRWQGVLVHRGRDGREITVESRWVARYDDVGALIGGFGIERPVAGLDELADERAIADGLRDHQEAELRRAERLDSLGQLAGGVAHDFNNALGIVINYAAFVAAEIKRVHAQTGEERWLTMQEDLGEIQSAAERAAGLTRQLGMFARQEPGAPAPLVLNEVITGIDPLLRRTLGAHITLELSLGADLPALWADGGQLQQVLVNLAANARDAMPEGGSVSIATSVLDLDADADAAVEGRSGLAPGRYLELRFTDTGSGMTPEVRERAFDPFFTTKPLGQGTGLGLSSVHGIIARSGGHAELRSEPGAGTTFIALLPVRPGAAEADAITSSAARTPAVGETILLVEDERALREAARRMLAGAGYTVLAAGDGQEALEVAAGAGAIELLLTDVVMPGMIGPQVADALRAERPAIRVLFMSGYADAAVGPGNINPAHLIEKPFTAAQLLARVRAAVSRTPAGGDAS